METIGFVGLGAMGDPMARNVAAAGFELVVYNRTRERAETFAAATDAAVAESPRAVAERSDAVVTIVPDDEAVRDVLAGDEGLVGGLTDGTVLVEMSTITPAATLAAAEEVAAAGGLFVDAPVSGTVGPAEEGTLTVLAGGDTALLDEVDPLLAAMGDPIVRCGDVGAGTRAKLFVNLLLGDMMGAFAEALVFGARQGLDLGTMRRIVEAGAVDSPLFRAKGAAIAERDFEPRFRADYQLKDLSYALEAAGEAGRRVSLPQTAATRESFRAASAMGHGDEDMTVVLKYLEAIAGVTVGDP
jgi:3-hydroxyisobutyrate dehydrogenase/2-hydroxy-3-oxopropionate reductase